jgi:hypothetical protein
VLTLGTQAFRPKEYYFHALGVLRRARVLRLVTLFPGRLVGLRFPFSCVVLQILLLVFILFF